jgi:sulfate/thiosulfate transport system permease protein
MVSTASIPQIAPVDRSGWLRTGGRLLGRATGPALSVTYLSVLVLLPVAALATQAFSGGWHGFWSEVTEPEGLAALRLTLACSALVAVVNAVAGVAVAWVLVRDQFRGKSVLGVVIDLPFALPTVVAGLTLLSLYGPDSPFHLDAADTQLAVVMALGFVTLPFVVRSVQPVLAALDENIEKAAESLGAGPFTVWRRIVLPSITPAILAGAGLAFARAIGEYGSVVLFSGNLPFHTEVASSWIFSLTQSGELPAASAVSIVLLALALVVLLALGMVRRRFRRRGVLV